MQEETEGQIKSEHPAGVNGGTEKAHHGQRRGAARSEGSREGSELAWREKEGIDTRMGMAKQSRMGWDGGWRRVEGSARGEQRNKLPKVGSGMRVCVEGDGGVHTGDPSVCGGERGA